LEGGIIDGFDFHIPHGYIYLAAAFQRMVALFNAPAGAAPGGPGFVTVWRIERWSQRCEFIRWAGPTC
jgi:hypothetical protein